MESKHYIKLNYLCWPILVCAMFQLPAFSVAPEISAAIFVLENAITNHTIGDINADTIITNRSFFYIDNSMPNESLSNFLPNDSFKYNQSCGPTEITLGDGKKGQLRKYHLRRMDETPNNDYQLKLWVLKLSGRSIAYFENIAIHHNKHSIDRRRGWYFDVQLMTKEDIEETVNEMIMMSKRGEAWFSQPE